MKKLSTFDQKEKFVIIFISILKGANGSLIFSSIKIWFCWAHLVFTHFSHHLFYICVCTLIGIFIYPLKNGKTPIHRELHELLAHIIRDKLKRWLGGGGVELMGYKFYYYYYRVFQPKVSDSVIFCSLSSDQVTNWFLV